MLDISVKKEEDFYKVELNGDFDARSAALFDQAINGYEL